MEGDIREQGQRETQLLNATMGCDLSMRPATPPIRNLFTKAFSLPCLALVLSFYEWSSKLAVRVTSGQAALTTSERVERLLEAGAGGLVYQRPDGGLFYAAPNSVKLHEFFSVSERTVRRW